MSNSEIKQVSSGIIPSSQVSLHEFLSITGGSEELVREIVELGWIVPSKSATDQLLFNSGHI